MTPAAPEDDRTQITPPPGSGPGGAAGDADIPLGFDKTELYAPPPRPAPPPPPPPAAPQHDMGNGLPAGTRLHEFEISKLLGEGGFGIVYLSLDTMLRRRVALKEYMPSSLAQRTESSEVKVKSERYAETFNAGMKSFINEAQLLASFDHPSLVKVYRFWEQNGTAYMVMPFYEGKNLRDTLRSLREAPTEDWLLSVLDPLTEALEVIHAQNCYHRDIAPDNVMMLADTGKPLLLDFGAARRVIGDMTQALTVILKPGYAPVEQYAEIPGMKQGAWTDVYALAAVVHYAITGRTPPPSVGRLLNDTYQPLAQVAAGRYSAGFLAAVDRALAVRPEARTPSIAQFRQEIGLGSRTLSAPPPPRPVPVSEPTVLLSPTAMAPTEIVSPGALAGGMARTMMAPAPTAMPATAMAQPAMTAVPAGGASGPAVAAPAAGPAKGKGALIGAAVAAVLVLGGGFAVWQMQGAPAPAPVAEAPAAQAPAAVPAPAPAPPPPVVFDAAREFDRVLAAQTGGFGVRAEPLKTDLSIAARDQVRFRVTAERDGHLYVIGLSADGSLAVLVPNSLTPSVRVRKGQAFQFPVREGLTLTANPPTGPGRMLVLVSELPRDFAAMAPQDAGLLNVLASGDDATRLLQSYAGSTPIMAGRPECPGGGTGCADAYGAALMNFNTLP
jgi:serine/threonine protein kinase